MFKKIKERWNTSDRALLVIITLLDISAIAFFIYSIIHPRVANILLLLVMLIYSYRLDKIMRKTPPRNYEGYTELEIYFYKKRNNKSDSPKYKYIFECLVLVVAIFYCKNFLNIFFPYHMVWEYKYDIEEFKEEYGEEYDHFPDELPESAKHVKWVITPGIMQGNSFEYLHFSADKNYIDEVIREYSEVMIYTSDEYGDFPVSFPGMKEIADGKEKYITVYVIYDNGDWNHQHIYGFYVNRKDNQICFFNE